MSTEEGGPARDDAIALPPAKRPHNEAALLVPSGTILGAVDLARALLAAPPDPPTDLEARVQLALAAHIVYALPGAIGVRFRDAARARVQPDAAAPDDVYVYAHDGAALRCLGHAPEDALEDALEFPSFGELERERAALERALNTPV